MKLHRRQEAADRMAEAQPVIDAFESLDIHSMRSGILRAAALSGMDDWAGALAELDRLLARRVQVVNDDYEEAASADLPESFRMDLESLLVAGVTRDNIKQNGAWLHELVGHGGRALGMKAMALAELGRMEHAWLAAGKAVDAARVINDNERRAGAQKVRAFIASRQRRYDRWLIARFELLWLRVSHAARQTAGSQRSE